MFPKVTRAEKEADVTEEESFNIGKEAARREWAKQHNQKSKDK